jgi:hypothetical protein
MVRALLDTDPVAKDACAIIDNAVPKAIKLATTIKLF